MEQEEEGVAKMMPLATTTRYIKKNSSIMTLKDIKAVSDGLSKCNYWHLNRLPPGPVSSAFTIVLAIAEASYLQQALPRGSKLDEIKQHLLCTKMSF